jgi:hypothetical protein
MEVRSLTFQIVICVELENIFGESILCFNIGSNLTHLTVSERVDGCAHILCAHVFQALVFAILHN